MKKTCTVGCGGDRLRTIISISQIFALKKNTKMNTDATGPHLLVPEVSAPGTYAASLGLQGL